MHSSNTSLSFLMRIMQHICTVLYTKLPPIILSYSNTHPSSRQTRIMSNTEWQAITKTEQKKMEWHFQSMVHSVHNINQTWRSLKETEKNKIKTEKAYVFHWFLQIWVILTGNLRQNLCMKFMHLPFLFAMLALSDFVTQVLVNSRLQLPALCYALLQRVWNRKAVTEMCKKLSVPKGQEVATLCVRKALSKIPKSKSGCQYTKIFNSCS